MFLNWLPVCVLERTNLKSPEKWARMEISMTKKDVLELKRRLKKNECTFTRMSGCYVNAHKEVVLSFAQNFLNLEDEEFYKYLEIAKKVLSGTLGNNLLEYEFPLEEEAPGGKQQFLMGLRADGLNNEELLNRLYERIIESYDYVGNYLILVFHDAYDVIVRTNDNIKNDESDEVYEYLLCAICPVELTKPGLGYREDENRIGVRIRDWVVNVPENGFLFPAFTDRSTDIHSVLFYAKNPKDPHPELSELAFGCTSRRTAAEKKQSFQAIIKQAIPDDEERGKKLFEDVQNGLQELIEEQEDEFEEEPTPVVLTKEAVQGLMNNIRIPEEVSAKITKSYEAEFEEDAPTVDQLLDTKAVAAGAARKKEQELVLEVEALKAELTQEKSENQPGPEKDVILKVSPDKVPEIRSDILEGRKCIIIPLDEHEHANINGTRFE